MPTVLSEKEQNMVLHPLISSVVCSKEKQKELSVN